MPTSLPRRFLLLIFLIWTALCLAVIYGCALLPPPSDRYKTTMIGRSGRAKEPAEIGERQPGEKGSRGPGYLTQAQLQVELMGFADRFATMVEQAASDFEIKLASSQARVQAARSRVYALASAFEIASGQDVGIALLDMLVMVTLSRIVWEEHWRPQVFGDSAEVIVETFRKLEADIWSIADKVLTPEQQEEMRALILAWRRENPEQTGVEFVRFSGFGELQEDSSLGGARRPGGLFPEVAEAARAADEIRLFAERAIYMISRMQLIASFQVQMAYKDLLTQPEVEQILSDGAKFMDTTDRLAALLEQLPAKVTEERSAAIDQLGRRSETLIDRLTGELSKERERVMQDLLSQEGRLKDLFADLQQMLQTGNELTSRIQTTVASVNTLAGRFDTGTPQTDAAPFDINAYREIAAEFSTTADRLNTLVESVNKMLVSPGWERRMPQVITVADRVEVLGEEWINRSFVYGVALILIFFLTMLLYRLASTRHAASRKGQGIAAAVLAVAAASLLVYLALSNGIFSKAVLSNPDPGGTQIKGGAVIKPIPTPDPGFFSSSENRPNSSAGDETESDPKSRGDLSSPGGASFALAAMSTRNDAVSIHPPKSTPASGPGSGEPVTQGMKRGEDSQKEQPTPYGADQLTATPAAYTLHFDSFRSPNRARKRVQSLKSLGLDAFSRRVDLPAKGIFHRVLVGQFENRGQAREFQAHLQRKYGLTESRIISAAAKH